MKKEVVYRAWFNEIDGSYAIQRWHPDCLKPDGIESFWTYEEAHAVVVKQFEEWLKSEQERLERLKKITTLSKYDEQCPLGIM